MNKPIISGLSFKIGSAIIAIESVVLALLGWHYTRAFSEQVDRQHLDYLKAPAKLMSMGFLPYEAISDTNIMHKLTGGGLNSAVLFGRNGNIFESLNPKDKGRDFQSLAETELPDLNTLGDEGLLRTVQKEGAVFTEHVAPIKSAGGQMPFLYYYAKTDMSHALQLKSALARRFLLGSCAVVAATSLAIFLIFRRWVVLPAKGLVEVLGKLEKGDLNARSAVQPRSTEEHFLQRGVNSMADRLCKMIGTLETSVRDLRNSEAARQERETNLKQFFEAAPIPLGISRWEDGTMLMVNQAFGLLVRESPEKLIGKDTDQFYTRPSDRQHLRKVIEDHGRVDQVEIEIKNLEGAISWVSISMVPMEYFGQKALAIGLHDISRRKAVEAEQQALRDQLAQSQKLESIGRLAGGVAHDFNNLLTVILGNLGLALEEMGDSNASTHELLREIGIAGEKASELTRQLLAFSRKQMLQVAVFDLNTLIRDFEKMLKRLIGEDISITTKLNAGQSRIQADKTQIEQVLLNLAVNARDAMPEGGVITIETATIGAGKDNPGFDPCIALGDCVLLSVSDTGTGMSEETKSHIFEPFFTTKEQGKGTGLGLATVYGIVKQHGGHIAVTSKPGNGSTFTICLPLVATTPLPVSASPEIKLVKNGRETILVVEDEPAVRRMTCQMLASKGYALLEAKDGAEALNMLAGPNKIDLLLTDVVMPGMNGYQVYKAASKMQSSLKVLFVSGYAHDNTNSELIEKGAPFLQKPFTAKSLHEKIRQALDA